MHIRTKAILVAYKEGAFFARSLFVRESHSKIYSSAGHYNIIHFKMGKLIIATKVQHVSPIITMHIYNPDKTAAFIYWTMYLYTSKGPN